MCVWALRAVFYKNCVLAGQKPKSNNWGISIQKQSGTVSESSRPCRSFGVSPSFWEVLVRKKFVFFCFEWVSVGFFLIPRAADPSVRLSHFGIRQPRNRRWRTIFLRFSFESLESTSPNTIFFRTKPTQKLADAPNERQGREFSETVSLCFWIEMPHF